MTAALAPCSTDFLRALDRRDRCVMALFYADELTEAEIGLVLDMPEHDVRSTLTVLRERARRFLARAGRLTSARTGI